MPGSPERQALGRLSRSVGDKAPLVVLMLRVPVAVSRGVGCYGDGRGLIPSPPGSREAAAARQWQRWCPRGRGRWVSPPPGKELMGSSARERAPCSLTRVLPTSEAGPALARCISAARSPVPGCRLHPGWHHVGPGAPVPASPLPSSTSSSSEIHVSLNMSRRTTQWRLIRAQHCAATTSVSFQTLSSVQKETRTC